MGNSQLTDRQTNAGFCFHLLIIHFISSFHWIVDNNKIRSPALSLRVVFQCEIKTENKKVLLNPSMPAWFICTLGNLDVI